jgi:hypothetical protein
MLSYRIRRQFLLFISEMSYSSDEEDKDIDDFELDATTLEFSHLLRKLTISKESISKTSKFAVTHPQLTKEFFAMIFRRLEHVSYALVASPTAHYYFFTLYSGVPSRKYRYYIC